MIPNPGHNTAHTLMDNPSLEVEQGGLLHSSARAEKSRGFQQHEGSLVSQRLLRKVSPPRGSLGFMLQWLTAVQTTSVSTYGFSHP